MPYYTGWTEFRHIFCAYTAFWWCFSVHAFPVNWISYLGFVASYCLSYRFMSRVWCFDVASAVSAGRASAGNRKWPGQSFGVGLGMWWRHTVTTDPGETGESQYQDAGQVSLCAWSICQSQSVSVLDKHSNAFISRRWSIMVYETKLPRQHSSSTVTEDCSEDSEVMLI